MALAIVGIFTNILSWRKWFNFFQTLYSSSYYRWLSVVSHISWCKTQWENQRIIRKQFIGWYR